MRWKERAGPQHDDDALAHSLGVHPLVVRLLRSRGRSSADEMKRFLNPSLQQLHDPSLLKGMTGALDRLTRAVEVGEQITVYGDYDVDGVTSTAMLVHFLRAVGARVDDYIPDRLREGYGINTLAVQTLAARGTRLLVSVDCGVSAVAEVDAAQAAGVDVIVVDHHQAPPELPRAVAMLNPHQPGCSFPDKNLCAAGVVFHLIVALRRHLRDRGHFAGRSQPSAVDYLDLAVLGTVADVVPLVATNRVLVACGLPVLERSRRPGVAALRAVSRLKDAPLSASDVGFRLAPRLNAAGRLEHADIALRLLLSEDPVEAAQLAEQLDTANADRQVLQQKMQDEALRQAEPWAANSLGVVVAADGWHPGVVGIVASRLVEAYHRPTVVIGLDGDVGKGSCRSRDGFHMFEALSRCGALLDRYGGHHHAAGLTLRRSNLEAFRHAFAAEAARQLRAEDCVPTLVSDGVLPIDQVNPGLAEALAPLAPFGAGNPEPVWRTHVSGVSSQTMGADRSHLRFQMGRLKAVAFGQADRAERLRGDAEVAFSVGIDTYQGRSTPTARVRYIGPATAGQPVP